MAITVNLWMQMNRGCVDVVRLLLLLLLLLLPLQPLLLLLLLLLLPRDLLLLHRC